MFLLCQDYCAGGRGATRPWRPDHPPGGGNAAAWWLGCANAPCRAHRMVMIGPAGRAAIPAGRGGAPAARRHNG
ncbi:hypothetical protein HMPREF0731_3035 [Pseudoroseomonas cervicalis ATCC 49957]|uniref:Uncharacterized protein n=1 Tax=Pseudoroseomonas cervicalis ATCC 49957 TaxID=525371 RepID=D5RPM3_9PROT|nr:hypothetical protein HMPREF0731_3035 [Pseudoroseomonas cervicalis ATCC 49957]